MGVSEEQRTSVELRREDNTNAAEGVGGLQRSDVESPFEERRSNSGELSSRTWIKV
jgi:hypothetical protein